MGLNGSSYDYIIIPRASLITNFQPPLANSGTWGLVLEQRIDSVCSTCKEALVSGYFFVTCWNVCGLDQDYWSSKIVLDCLIILFWTSWSLDLEWFKGQIALMCSWSVDLCSLEVTLIPWSTLGKVSLLDFWSWHLTHIHQLPTLGAHGPQDLCEHELQHSAS